MKKRRNSIIAFLSVLILIFNTTVSAYAVNITVDENSKSKRVIFLTDGEGSENYGDGSEKNPYKNIRTALKNANSGDTIKIVNQVKYWRYEEDPNTKLPLPLIIDKELNFEGVDRYSTFVVRSPIQLGADVTFKSINMQFWASNELMPGVPDPGLPQNAVDEGTKFRSGRTIYLAGNKLTLDNVDTMVHTASFTKTYRPYISGGTFMYGGAIGSKAVLNVINPNEGTEFAGIYAGDYWTERSYPVELNIAGKVIDKTIHTGGIMNEFKGDVEVNINKGVRVTEINKDKHTGNIDVGLKKDALLFDMDFTGIRNLSLEKDAEVNIKSDEFNVNNLTLGRDALLDLRDVKGSITVNGDFIGETGSVPSNEIPGGAIFLNNNQLLDIKGDVKGVTRLNSRSDVDKVYLKNNHTYIKAKENAEGTFRVYPHINQDNYRLIKDTSNPGVTTWRTVTDKNVFKSFRWNGSTNDIITNPNDKIDYEYPIEYINDGNKVYTPSGYEMYDFSITLEKPDGTILDDDNFYDGDLSIELQIFGAVMRIYNTNFSGEVTLKVTHKNGSFITKKIQIGKITTSKPPVINGADDKELKVSEVDEFNKDLLAGITVSDDKDTIDPKKIKVTGKVGKPDQGKDDEYKITYEVTDSDKNTTTVTRTITVTNRLPEIVANDVTIKKGQAIDLLKDARIGLDATDYEDDNKPNITVKSTGGLNQANPLEGKYKVIYIAKDSDGNTSEKEITITVNSNNAPVINGVKNITIKVGEVDKFNLLDGITVTDDYDNNLKATVSGTISKPASGTNKNSTITYTAKDSDGNITKVNRVITVTNQLPTIDGLSNITIKRGQTADLRKGVTAKDNEDGTITSKIVYPTTNLSTLDVGKHNITYKVTDSDNNTITKTRIVNVQANTVAKKDLIGIDRYETAVKISKEGWPLSKDKAAKTVILVNGLNAHLVDGLTATPLASALDAPILLSRNSSIPKSTIDEIKRLNPSEIIVIGGTTAINQSVIDELKGINKNILVERISGINRYETSLNIAKKLDSIVPIKKIYVGAGMGEADSLSISPVAGKEKSPIILTAKDSVDNDIYNYLKGKKLSDAYFIGGTTVISNKVIEQINSITSKNVSGNRIAGINRRETNANVIEKFYPESTLNGVVIAKDLDLVDALAVGPLAAKREMPVVLAQNVLSEGQEVVLKNKTSGKMYQAGGGVSTSVLDKLKYLLTN